MSNTIRTLGRPEQVWSDGGPPYNSNEWKRWNKEWGIRARRTTPYHPPANGMVERFNQGIKRAILAAYVAELDPEDEVVNTRSQGRNRASTCLTKISRTSYHDSPRSRAQKDTGTPEDGTGWKKQRTRPDTTGSTGPTHKRSERATMHIIGTSIHQPPEDHGSPSRIW